MEKIVKLRQRSVLLVVVLVGSLMSLTDCNKSAAGKPQVVKMDYAYYNPLSLVLKEKHFLEGRPRQGWSLCRMDLEPRKQQSTGAIK